MVAPGPTPFPPVSVPQLVSPHTRALSPSGLPPEEGLRGESPLPRLAPHSAHGNEKHIGFIIPGLNEQGCHGDSHLRPARGQERGW